MDRREILKMFPALAGAIPALLYSDRAWAQLKVTDPDKQVTDTNVMTALANAGIDKDYVEFDDDYVKRPYSKGYTDRITGQKVLVSSGLPMRRLDDGTKISCGLESSAGKHYLKNNLIEGYIEGTGVHVSCVNNQPTGQLKNDEAHWSPTLYIGGIEQAPLSMTLLPIDPLNQFYTNNTIEWDYGVCKRQVRIIEGRVRGRWIFTSNPKADIRIVYNKTGDLHYKIGTYRDSSGALSQRVVSIKDEERLSKVVLDTLIYPLVIGDTLIVYPDAAPESTSVDGFVNYENDGVPWGTLIAGGGSAADDSSDAISIAMQSGTATDWLLLWRGFTLFDTSALTAEATISATTLGVYGNVKLDENSQSPESDVNIYASNPISETALIAGDFDAVSGIAFCDSAIGYSAWNTGTPGTVNLFTFNATGRAAVSKTGISKFCQRFAYHDVGENVPDRAGNSDYTYSNCWASDKGATFKPTLTVTYTAGWSGVVMGVTNPESYLGVPKADIKAIKGIP